MKYNEEFENAIREMMKNDPEFVMLENGKIVKRS